MLLSACGGGMGGMDMGDGTSGSPSASTAGQEGAMAMPTSAPGAFNDADVAYAQGMIAHCSQLVEMSGLAPARASDQEVKGLASRTRTDEEAELAAVRGWLRYWNRPESADEGDMGGMDMGGDDGGDMTMSGSMSDADMKELKAAKGGAFDRAFVKAVIEHRNGEIEMSRDEQKNGRNVTVKQQAEMMATMQEDEVKSLTTLLAKL
uniref:Lipoprotein n=3 Tax=Streptomyces TaxID=1883 RepID=V9Z5L4_9ACTN|nr:DUF305 domain-containing protein [Streptomyces sp. FR1]AHE38904.1 Lipoprotein [Streptomyces sp. FR1]AHE39388.1 Lipoprotein [Streptomyces sp. F2]